MISRILSLVTVIIFLSACTLLDVRQWGDVKPWDKAHMANKHMQFDPDPMEQSYLQHIYSSKENSSGGYGVGGGGCGCN